MRIILTLSGLVLCLAVAAWAAPPRQINKEIMTPPPIPQRGPSLQLAILLDTSNSMDNLIHQARTQLWEIVNRLEELSLEGHRPRLEIALFEYGNSRLPESAGYIRLVSPLTSDLDRVSELLFDLRTNGGAEYAPQVTQEALNYLRWSHNRRSYRAIVVAGNETFRQGPVRLEPVAAQARQQGIFVNTIFCGNYSQGIQLGWKKMARLAGGEYRHISLHEQDVYIEAPQDSRIRDLNRKLNATYLAYGEVGEQAKKRQVAQDEAVASASAEALVQRSRTKAGKAYRNESWDLVDAMKENPEAVKNISPSALPREFHGLSAKQVEQEVKKKAKEREAIQQQIRQLTKEREIYLVEKRKGQANNLRASLAPVFVEQALKMGFEKSN